MGVSPGRDTGCAESMSTPGETIDARKVCVPRARPIDARKTDVPRTRRFIVCIGLLLYMIGLNANSQEALSRCMNEILDYYCI